MRIAIVGLVMVCGQGCIGNDYLNERSRFGGVQMSHAERFRCEMDSLRPGCQFVVPRQQVHGEFK